MLTRFAYDDSYFGAGGRARPKAFLPSKEDNKTSMFRLGVVGHEVKLAHAALHGRKDKTLKGYVEVHSDCVLAVDLAIEDDIPPPAHVNVVGWPLDVMQQKSIAQEIAASASFRPAGTD